MIPKAINIFIVITLFSFVSSSYVFVIDFNYSIYSTPTQRLCYSNSNSIKIYLLNLTEGATFVSPINFNFIDCKF